MPTNLTCRSPFSVPLIGLLSLGSPVTALASDPPAELPSWLKATIEEAAAGPQYLAPIAIWQITHKGKLAYLVLAPCCDQYNPLYDASGQVLCHPNGGIHGRGDSKCPNPADRGSSVNFIWSHPQAPTKSRTVPALGQ